MKKMEFQLPYFKVDITLLQVEGKEDENDVAELLKSMDIQDIKYTLDGIRNGAVNGGDTYRDLNNKRIFVLFYPIEDNIHRAEIYSHEKRHIEDRVFDYFGVNDIESAGLLAGFLGEKFYEFWKIVDEQSEQKNDYREKYIADVFEKVGLAKIIREQSNDNLTKALQDAMLELSKFTPLIKDGVDAIVHNGLYGSKYIKEQNTNAFSKALANYNSGDKVKIIIVKEEQ